MNITQLDYPQNKHPPYKQLVNCSSQGDRYIQGVFLTPPSLKKVKVPKLPPPLKSLSVSSGKKTLQWDLLCNLTLRTFRGGAVGILSWDTLHRWDLLFNLTLRTFRGGAVGILKIFFVLRELPLSQRSWADVLD